MVMMWVLLLCVWLIGAALNALIERTAPPFVGRVSTMAYGGAMTVVCLHAMGWLI